MPRNDFTVTVRNQSALAANFQAASVGLSADIALVVREYAEKERVLVQQNMKTLFERPIYDSGYMHDNVKSKVSPKGLAWETGWYSDDFANVSRAAPKRARRGLARNRLSPSAPAQQIANGQHISHSFYPVYVTFGTRKMQARDALTPTHAEIEPQFLEALRERLSAGLQARVRRTT